MTSKIPASRAAIAVTAAVAVGVGGLVWATRGGGSSQQKAQAVALKATSSKFSAAQTSIYKPKRLDVVNEVAKEEFKPGQAAWKFTYPTVGNEKDLTTVLEGQAKKLAVELEKSASSTDKEDSGSGKKIVGPPLDAELTERKIKGELIAVTRTAIVVSLRAEITKPKEYVHRYRTVYYDRKENAEKPLDSVLKNKEAWVAELDKILEAHERKVDFASAEQLLAGIVVNSDGSAEVPLTTKNFTERSESEGLVRFDSDSASSSLSEWVLESIKPPPAPGGAVAPPAAPGKPLWVAAADVKQPEPVSAYSEDGTFVGRKVRGVNCAVTKCVALTFDDGPGVETGKLLDILEEKNVPATFFVVGKMVMENPQFVKRMHEQGHEIGSHTWSHPLLVRMSPEKIKVEMQKTADAVREATGQEITIYRPPYGGRNAKVDRAVGLPAILWDVDTLDWKHKNTAKTVEATLRGSNAGSIVLMHDIHGPTIAAVPAIIDGLRKRGFTLVTYDMLMAGKKVGQTETVLRGPKPDGNPQS